MVHRQPVAVPPGGTACARRPHRPSDTELTALEELAARAGPALENVRRFREARQLADLDALTNLHNPRYFHDRSVLPGLRPVI